MGRITYIFLIMLIIVNKSITAYADETLRNKISALEPLILHYGTNSLKVNNLDVLISKGVFVSEVAWGGDGYTTLVHEGKTWQLARLDERLRNETTIWSVPHTQEDAITSISFLIPQKETTSTITALYLLITHRDYKHNPLDLSPVEFSLYILQPDKDFGIYYFHKLQSETSKAKYCNADSAAYHELGIPLPGDGTEFPCVKSE